jgi:hypothetical protein
MNALCKLFSTRSIVSALLVILLAGESALISAEYRSNGLQSAETTSNITTIIVIVAATVVAGIFVWVLIRNSTKKPKTEIKGNKPVSKMENDTLSINRNQRDKDSIPQQAP